jgi:hypothetical protein
MPSAVSSTASAGTDKANPTKAMADDSRTRALPNAVRES